MRLFYCSAGILMIYAAVWAVSSRVSQEVQDESSRAFFVIKQDLGSVAAESVYSHTFRLENSWDAPIEVVRVSTDCSCQTIGIPGDKVRPGEEGRFTINLKTPRAEGFEASAFIETQVGDRPVLFRLTLTGQVDGALAKRPNGDADDSRDRPHADPLRLWQAGHHDEAVQALKTYVEQRAEGQFLLPGLSEEAFLLMSAQERDQLSERMIASSRELRQLSQLVLEQAVRASEAGDRENAGAKLRVVDQIAEIHSDENLSHYVRMIADAIGRAAAETRQQLQ